MLLHSRLLRRRWPALAALAAVLLGTLTTHADPPKQERTLPVGTLDTSGWLKASTAPLQPGEIDRLIAEQQQKAGVRPGPVVNHELFARRVYLDLTGRLPMPADVQEFLRDKRPDRRAQLVDRLLDSEDYAEHWARYWRDVIASKVTDFKGLFGVRGFEVWMTAQLRANRSWGDITRDLLTAGGSIQLDEPEKNGQAFFVSTRFGMDAPVELAAETSRIFLGIQIQCAQCHDHPSDVWKRQQFHEFAAYFARCREQPVFDIKLKRFTSVKLVSLPFAEHRMPGKDDPKKGKAVHPTFLDGKSPGQGLKDEARRTALADAITARDNPWFAAAFVNRTWGRFFGQAFYQPVDDLGPMKEAVMPTVIARVAGAFRGSNYDVKQLFRDVLTSQAYQRDIRRGDSPEEHLLFAGRNPVRMDAETLYQTLACTLGPFPRPPLPAKAPFNPFARFGGFEGQFKQEFAYDPSAKAEEIEGSISQALLLMNNPQLNQKLRAQGTSLLGRILTSYPRDDDALDMVYLRALARHPTTQERARCRAHVRSVGNRAEAFEDILWALINSTEYQMYR